LEEKKKEGPSRVTAHSPDGRVLYPLAKESNAPGVKESSEPADGLDELPTAAVLNQDDLKESEKPLINNHENNGTKPGTSLSRVVELWPKFVEEQMEKNPLLAGRFMGTTIRIDSENPAVVSIVFRKHSQYNLIKEDLVSLRNMRDLLKVSFLPDSGLELKVVEDLEPDSANMKPDEDGAAVFSNNSGMSEEELINEDPVFKHLFEIFEGRLVD